LAYGYELELPDRLKTKLNQGNSPRKIKQKKADFPVIRFFEYDGALQVQGGDSWQIIDEAGNSVAHDRIGESELFAVRANSDKVKILDLNLGYLLFDISGKLIYGSTLPLEAGFLLWRNNIKILSEIAEIDDGYLPLWPNWSFTYFQDISELLIELADGSIKKLESRKTVSVKDFIVPGIKDKDSNNIYFDYPWVEDNGYIKLTDHLNDTQIELVNHRGPVIEGAGGEIDLTLSSGLGKSKSFKGLVIPNFSVSGIENALRIGSVANVNLKLPENWLFTYPDQFKNQASASIQFKVEPNQETLVLKVKNRDLQEYFIGLEVPILSWSVEFTNRESVTVASNLQLDINSRKFVKAIILHGVTEYVPIMTVGEVPVPGRKRGNDARYDLRLLSDIANLEESAISIKWNYENICLISFIKAKSKKMQSVDIKNLANEAIAKNIISEEDWHSYQAETRKQSLNLRNLLRRQRGN
jgi:hypothetical protein